MFSAMLSNVEQTARMRVLSLQASILPIPVIHGGAEFISSLAVEGGIYTDVKNYRCWQPKSDWRFQ
jgi:hypothetical protein